MFASFNERFLIEFIGYSIGGSVAIFAISQLFYWLVFRKSINPSRYIYSSCTAYGIYNLISLYNLGHRSIDGIFENFFINIFQFSGALMLCLFFYWLYFVYVSAARKK